MEVTDRRWTGWTSVLNEVRMQPVSVIPYRPGPTALSTNDAEPSLRSRGNWYKLFFGCGPTQLAWGQAELGHAGQMLSSDLKPSLP